MPDFSTYEGRQAYRDSHPGTIVDASGAYNPYTGSETNTKGQEVRNTGKEPNRGLAPIGNTQAFNDLTPPSPAAQALNAKAATIEQQVQQAQQANQIPSGPANQDSFISSIVGNVLKGVQMTAAANAAQAAYQQKQAAQQQTISNAQSFASTGRPYTPLPNSPGPSQNGQYSNFGAQQYQTLPNSPNGSGNPLSMLLMALLGSAMGFAPSSNTPPQTSNIGTAPTGPMDLGSVDPYKQAMQQAGTALNATPGTIQTAQQNTFQPLTQQQPRTIPSSLFSIPSTQLFSAFTPSEKTGMFLLGNGLGIDNQDLQNQMLRLAPPGGNSVQSFLGR